MTAEEKITKKMIIGTVLHRHPHTARIMFESGLHCIACPVAASESIEDGCRAHGMPDKKIDEMIEKMNKALESEE